MGKSTSNVFGTLNVVEQFCYLRLSQDMDGRVYIQILLDELSLLFLFLSHVCIWMYIWTEAWMRACISK